VEEQLVGEAHGKRGLWGPYDNEVSTETVEAVATLRFIVKLKFRLV
jgi:hypothetical protein